MKDNEVITKAPFYPALVKFIEGVNQMIREYWTRNRFTHNSPPTIMIESVGRRYARIAEYELRPALVGTPSPSSVYCFLDLTNGDLLKGSWKAPVANGVRGNLSDPHVLNHFTALGPAYLR